VIDIIPYSAAQKQEWNDVISEADNGHFMFNRDFMEYHSDRFQDNSFVVFYDDKIIAVIPGNIVGDKWYSHQGLSFGGLFIKPKYNRVIMVDKIFESLFAKLQEIGVQSIIYKFIPYIYHKKPCDSDIYVLSKKQITKDICEVSSAINLSNRNKFSELRIRGKKKANKAGIVYAQSDEWQSFWNILAERLGSKYEKKPVHSLEEIISLKNSFPDNIKLFTATEQNEGVCAGVVVFETNTVAHCQYISSSDFGMNLSALDGLFDFLINHYATNVKQYFNFGISTEDAGKVLNENLIQYKEGFGAQSMVHITRHFSLANS
jgi:hypothetical protein